MLYYRALCVLFRSLTMISYLSMRYVQQPRLTPGYLSHIYREVNGKQQLPGYQLCCFASFPAMFQRRKNR